MKPRKYEGTLRRVEMDAKRGMQAYKEVLRNEARGTTPYVVAPRMGKISLESSTEWDFRASSSEAIRAANNEHYHAHESEYHDLAVMEAHKEGVDVNLQQPLVIGDKKQEQ